MKYYKLAGCVIQVKSWWVTSEPAIASWVGGRRNRSKIFQCVCFPTKKKATALTTISTMNVMTLTLNNLVHGIIKSDASRPRGIWMARLAVEFESYESGWIKVPSRSGQKKHHKKASFEKMDPCVLFCCSYPCCLQVCFNERFEKTWKKEDNMKQNWWTFVSMYIRKWHLDVFDLPYRILKNGVAGAFLPGKCWGW